MSRVRESPAAVAKLCAGVLDENKLEDIQVFEVVNSLQIADYFVVATGRNPRQLKAASDELFRKLREKGVARWGLEGYESARWILIDFMDVVVHLFLGERRQFYGLDSLWGDCPRVAWRAKGGRVGSLSGKSSVEGL